MPEGWEWCRLKQIGNVIGGGTPKTNVIEYWDGKIPWITPADLSGYTDMYVSSGARKITEIGLQQSSAQLMPTGTILYSSRAPIGYVAIAKNSISTNQGFKSVVPYSGIISEYIYYCLIARTENIVMRATGTTFKEISGFQMAETIIPIPPSLEQVKISKYVTQILENITYISDERNVLQKLIESAKSKILNLAIQGKLVPQDENDEPASVLLKRIRTEKDELIKTGKIKRDKKESIIFRGDDNSYYESVGKNNCKIDNEYQTPLPDGWEYARLKSICTKIIDGSHNPPKSQASKSDYIMASSRNINHDTFVELDQVRYISKEDYEKENERTFIKENDILLTTVGSLGRSCIYQKFPSNLCVQRSITIISTLILPEYLKMYFDSPKFQEIIVTEATGTAQKGFYLNQLENVIIPIPPLTEQYAMTSYVQCLMFNIDQIYHMVRE